MTQEKHFACVNTAVCNKYGFVPNKLCAQNECKFLIEKEIEIAPEDLKGNTKDENKTGNRRKV